MLNLNFNRNIIRYFSNIKKNNVIPSSKQQKQKKMKYRLKALLGLSAFLGILTYFNNTKDQFQFIMESNQLNREIIEKNKYLDKELYIPTLYLRFGILQQLFAKYFESHTFVKQGKTEIIEDCLVRYAPIHHKIEEKNIQSSCAIIIGGSQGYNELMIYIMSLMSSNQFQVIGLNVTDFHDAEKLAKVVKKIKSERPGRRFHGVGIEYGANLLVISSALNPTLFDSISSLGNPLDLEQAQKKAENSYSAKLTFLSNIIQGRIGKRKLSLPPEATLYDVDKYIYKLKDEQQVKKFKQAHSSINYIHKLKVPTLLLQSKQDPLSIDLSSNEKIQANPLCLTILTKNGGHNEWFTSLHAYRWAPRMITSHLTNIDNILKNQKIL